MKKIIICSIMILTLAFTQSPIFALSSPELDSENDSIQVSDNESIEEVKINSDLDQLIMSVSNKDDKEKIFDYFYLPAYSKLEILEEGQNDDNNFDQIEQSNLETGKMLCSKSGKELDNELVALVTIGANQILSMDNIEITDDYCLYAKKYLSDELVTLINEKKNSYDESAIYSSNVYMTEPNEVTEATSVTTKKRTFKREYGSPSGAAYTMFKITVTWKYNSTKITSLTTTNQSITTPSFIQTTLQRKKTYISSSNNKYGYVQRGWGYVNLYYMDGKIDGYYIIDVKIKLGSVKKSNLTTISPLQWNSYSWG